MWYAAFTARFIRTDCMRRPMRMANSDYLKILLTKVLFQHVTVKYINYCFGKVSLGGSLWYYGNRMEGAEEGCFVISTSSILSNGIDDSSVPTTCEHFHHLTCVHRMTKCHS